MGAAESSDTVKPRVRDAACAVEHLEHVMLFGAMVSPAGGPGPPSTHGRAAAPLPFADLPASASELYGVSEAHAQEQIHCALCGKEFFFFFGVRTRRWCRRCGQPVCQRCTYGEGKLSIHVTCKPCAEGLSSEAHTPCGLAPTETELAKAMCHLCRQPYNFFRPQRRCRQCKGKLCSVCSVVPYARRGSYQEEAMCPACAYGVDIAVRPSGVNHQVLACQLCSQEFGFFRRRHWCRRCGATICWQCTPSTLFLTSRRHPNCICRRCHIPAVFQLSHPLAQYCLSWLDAKAQDRCLRVCTHFQRLIDLPFPLTAAFGDHYTIDHNAGLLGSGAFGKVYRCICRKTLQPYAVKVIPKRRIFSLKQWSVTLREIDIQSSIEHPNSIQLYHVVQTVDDVFLVMELAAGCDLAELLMRNQRLTESQIAHFVCQLLRFLRYIHSRSVVHRDIKPDNILISSDLAQVKVADFGLAKFVEPPTINSAVDLQSLLAPEETVGQLADARPPWSASPGASPASSAPQSLGPGRLSGRSSSFTGTSPFLRGAGGSEGTSLGVPLPRAPALGISLGSSSHSSFLAPNGLHTPPQLPGRHTMRVLCTPCGTLPFCAPEVLAPNAYRKRYPYRRVFKRDMYSLGVVVHLLLVGKLPYRGATAAALLEQMQRPVACEGPRWAAVSRRGKDFCARLLALGADERMSAEEALQHEWIAALAHWHGANELAPLGRLSIPMQRPPSPQSEGGASTGSDGLSSYLRTD
eukprot:EG_transcript_2671